MQLQAEKRYANQEASLAAAEKQDYIDNAKGISAMHALENYIGQQNVNLALKRFLRDWKSFNVALKSKTSNYPATKELLAYFTEVLPLFSADKVYNLFEKTKFDSNIIPKGK